MYYKWTLWTNAIFIVITLTVRPFCYWMYSTRISPCHFVSFQINLGICEALEMGLMNFMTWFTWGLSINLSSFAVWFRLLYYYLTKMHSVNFVVVVKKKNIVHCTIRMVEDKMNFVNFFFFFSSGWKWTKEIDKHSANTLNN